MACNAVKKARNVLEEEEQFLRRFMPVDVFETEVGNFYEIIATQGYIKARYSLVCKLVKINTYDAVKAARDNAMEMLRLCNLDHVGVRMIVPALFIRLGKDQECYDLIKWYTIAAPRGMKSLDDWRNKIVPFFDIKDADVFESLDGHFLSFEFAVALVLIKIRLLNDIRMLQSTFFMYDQLPLPPELVDRIRKEAIAGEIVSKRQDIFKRNNHRRSIRELVEEIQHLFMFVDQRFWLYLLDPEDSLALKPAKYEHGSDQHIQMVVQYYYEAYAETPSAIEMIRQMVGYDEESS